jgi:hypothetical protein
MGTRINVVHVTEPSAHQGRRGHLHHGCYVLSNVIPPNKHLDTLEHGFSDLYRSNLHQLCPMRINASYRVCDAASPAYRDR